MLIPASEVWAFGQGISKSSQANRSQESEVSGMIPWDQGVCLWHPQNTEQQLIPRFAEVGGFVAVTWRGRRHISLFPGGVLSGERLQISCLRDGGKLVVLLRVFSRAQLGYVFGLLFVLEAAVLFRFKTWRT